MRIIAGRRKGMSLLVPGGRSVRPTPDRVREALMSILGGQFHGEHMLDLFAGSGAVALECASRGCSQVVLVECAAAALQTIEANVERFAQPDAIQVLAMDMRHALSRLADDERRFDLVYLDPPYGLHLEEVALKELVSKSLLAKNAQVWVETESAELLLVDGYQRFDHRRYGRVHLHGLTHNEDVHVP
ncbi:MAG TPA: 16S rRNA (guanine(966)-N(2))-methyltransferase RsmD [Myxococcales bacterium]|nr:16S rRNA (guanine(966)-N(2))-methyltransferase RsmD [Myxococcales bacterium]